MKTRIGKYSHWNLTEFQEHYQNNYLGKSRTEVSKLDVSFYEEVYKRGLLDEIFPKRYGRFTEHYLKKLRGAEKQRIKKNFS